MLGFSWGGVLALRAASAALAEAFMGVGGPRFAAHVPLYPVCWSHLRAATDPASPEYATYRAFTGAPLLILAGGKDDYDASPQDCDKLLAALPEPARAAASLHVYPGATHAWDASGSAIEFQDPFSHGGKGRKVRIDPDRRAARDPRARVTEFFVRALRPGRP